MDIEAPWITEMNRTGTCREYETYYGIVDVDRKQDESDELEAE